MLPLISIIVPVYNVANYIERCIKSLCQQSYVNLEIILVNDGSVDNSGLICDYWASVDIRIKVFHTTNNGASLARKFGLDKATGSYVTFVDSDDYVDCRYIEILYDLILKFNISISACLVARTRIGDIIKENDIIVAGHLISFMELMPRFFKYEFWGLPGKLYNIETFERITFPKATLSEDYAIMLQLFCNEQNLAYIDTPLYFYEYHSESLSHTRLSKRAFEEFTNVRYVYNYIVENYPQYSNMALSNVVETSIKLLSMGVNDERQGFNVELNEICKFLHNNFWQIIFGRSIYWKLKIMILYYIVAYRLIVSKG